MKCFRPRGAKPGSDVSVWINHYVKSDHTWRGRHKKTLTKVGLVMPGLIAMLSTVVLFLLRGEIKDLLMPVGASTGVGGKPDPGTEGAAE